MFFPIADWFPAFVVTLAIEAVIVTALLRGYLDLVRLGVIIVFANLATHLAVWYVVTQLLTVNTPEYLVVAEVSATAAEALIFWAAIRGVSPGRALVVAVVANAASFGVGRFIGRMWPDVFG